MAKLRKASSTHVVSDSEMEKLMKNALGIMANCRREILDSQPFIGTIAMGLNLVPTRDSRISTAMTDGTSVYFDIGFLAELTPDERKFVIAHEIWHNVFQHTMRFKDYDHKIANLAEDLEINQLLAKDGMTVPKSACMPDKFDVKSGLSAEEYYDILKKRSSQNQRGQGYGQQNQPGGQSGNCPGDDGHQDDEGPNGSGDSPANPEQAKASGTYDEHIYDGESIEDKPDTHTSDKYGKVGHDPNLKPEPSEQALEHIRSLAISAAQAVERQRGSLPGHIAAIINKITESEVPWEQLITQFVTKGIGSEQTYMPPNRRHVWHEEYFPSRRGKRINVALGIDTSGSTNSDLPRFLGELKGLLDSFGNYDLHVIQCDTEVRDYSKYDDANEFDFENEDHITLKGGGGTELHPIVDYINDNQIEADMLIMFTDGYTEKFTEDNTDLAMPLLWVISSEGTTSNAEVGEIVKMSRLAS